MARPTFISLVLSAFGLVNAVALPQAGNALADILSSIPAGLASDAKEASEAFTAYASILQAATPTTTPTKFEDAQSKLSSIFSSASASPTAALLDGAIALVKNGFTSSEVSAISGSSPVSPIDSTNNNNPRQPSSVIYPKAGQQDAPYSISEADLRAALYIPDTFKYGSGSATPFLLVPGTGSYGGSVYAPNMAKLFQGSDIADVCWLNIPGALLGDIQDSAEYVAYAINYLSGITGRDIAIASWSQGSIDIAWAFTYWPSTRSKVSDVINYSGDLHGTVNAYALCPGFPKLPCDPSVVQQTYDSDLIHTLRNAGGAAAYVPTTAIYSSFFDEVVQPQTLSTASAFVTDDRGVGVSNNEIQSICSGTPGGGFYSHEGVLYSPLAYYLTLDALTHDGPGNVDRVGLDKACGSAVTPGLSLADVLATEALIPEALVWLLLYVPKTFVEPAIRSYAQ